MEFLTESSEFSREAREEREDNIGNLFLWSIAVMVLLGLNAFSWIICLYIFGNPEVPFNYRLLTKIDRLDPIVGFKTTDAPRGKFFSAKNLYLEYYDYTVEKRNAYNGILKRFYLYNYRERDDVKFISGSFKVESSRKLRPDDVFPHGIAVRLVAEDFPAAHVDFVLPCPAEAAIPEETFRPGDVVQIQESATCAALLHVQRLAEDHICFTAVPLVKREYETPSGAKLQIEPPERLNLGSGHWPISNDGTLIAKPVEPEPADEGDEPAKADAPPAETSPPPAEEAEKPKR